jgi:4-hydroxy-3-polyprenylbenzoate decarboxylase
MAYDLRDYVEDLKKAGDLVEINDEVDWNYEIAAYEVLSGRFGGPAFLFNNIKGIPKGPRALTAQFVGTFRRPHTKAAIAMGLEPQVDRTEWNKVLAKRMSMMLRPVEASSGTCKEIVKMGKEVNLLEFPFTYHAVGDGGRNIICSAAVIKDPDSSWINTGNYAIEVFSKNRLVITPYAHTNFLAIYTQKYQARGQSMPVAICLGGDPAVTMAAGMILPPGVSEYDIAGGIRGTPIELVKAETSDLWGPANAAVGNEGEIRAYERLPAGPKIEVFGFSVGPRQPFYPIRVHCITYRKNPIIWDTHTALGTNGAALQLSLAGLGFKSIANAFGFPYKLGDVFSPVRSGGMGHAAILRKSTLKITLASCRICGISM